MVIMRYIVTICTREDECGNFTADTIASYVQEGLIEDSNSKVTAAVVKAEYKDEGEPRFDIREDA